MIFFFAGRNSATTCPRRVIVTDWPVCVISSSSNGNLLFASVTVTIRVPIYSSYSERHPRPKLKGPGTAGPEHVARPRRGLPERRCEEVIDIPAEISKVEHVEHLAKNLPLGSLG